MECPGALVYRFGLFSSPWRRIRDPYAHPSSIIAFIMKSFNYFYTYWLPLWDWTLMEGRSFIFFVFVSPAHGIVFGIQKSVSRRWNNQSVGFSTLRYLVVSARLLGGVWSWARQEFAPQLLMSAMGTCPCTMMSFEPLLCPKFCYMLMIRSGEGKRPDESKFWPLNELRSEI